MRRARRVRPARGVRGLRVWIFAVGCCLLWASVPGRAERPRVYAIAGARVVVSPGKILDKGTVVVRDGLIEAVGEKVTAPADAFVLDGAGKTITAGFIDSCTDIGQKKSEGPPPGAGESGGPPQRGAPKEPPPGVLHPLPRVHPERRAEDLLLTDPPAFEKHRAMGFTTALTLPGEGIFRGEAALIDLGGGSPSEYLVSSTAGQTVAFEAGTFGQGYPTSLMGSIAAVRQTLLDSQRHAVWKARYEASPNTMQRPDQLPAFDALADALAKHEPFFFDLPDSDNVHRAMAVANEFSLPAVIIGSGLEALDPSAMDALKTAGRPVIVPLAYPEKPKVEEPDEALGVTLRDLERWDGAPENPAKLHQAGISFALGTCRIASASEFPERLRKAIERGLPADVALAALTTVPAQLLGKDRVLGTIEAGRIGNLTVFSDAPSDGMGVFDKKAKVTQVFVDGVKYEIEQKKSKGDPNAKVDPRGTWSITYVIGGRTISRVWTIKGAPENYSGTAETQSGVVEFSSVKLAGNELTVVLPAQGDRPSSEIAVVITGESLEGSGEFPDGTPYSVKGSRTAGPEGGAAP